MADKTTQFIEFKTNADKAAKDIVRLEQEVAELNAELKKVGQNSSQYDVLTGKLKSLRRELSESKRSAKEFQAGMKASTLASKNLTGANIRMSDSAGAANAVLMQTGFAASDMAYGIRGVGNNISAMTAAFQNLTASTGGSKNALKSLASTLTGPAGIFFAIQIVIGALLSLDEYMRANKSSSDNFAKTLGAQGGAIAQLRIYADVIEKGDKQSKIYQKSLKELKDKGFDPATQSVRDFIAAQIDLIRLRAKQQVIEEDINKIAVKELKVEEKIRELNAKIKKQQAIIDDPKQTSAALKSRAQGRIEYLEGLKQGFQEDLAEIDTEYAKYQKELQEILTGQADGEKGVDGDKNGKGGSDEPIVAGSIRWYKEKIKQAIADFNNELSEDKRRNLLKQIQEWNSIVADMENPPREDQVQPVSEITPAGLTPVGEDPEVLLAQNQTDLILEQEERKNRRLNELRAEELAAFKEKERQKIDISKETVGFLDALSGAIGRNTEEGMRVQQIAALANAYMSINQIWSKNFSPFGPDDIAQKVIATATVGAITFANVKNIEDQRRKLGGGGGGATVAAKPQFNVVGNTGTSQIAGAIGQQTQDLQNKPIKAYVVSSDVTSQQALDRKIEGNASLGDSD